MSSSPNFGLSSSSLLSSSPVSRRGKKNELAGIAIWPPATIFCFSDSSVFCQNFDWEAHSSRRCSPAVVHDRRPLEGFSGCPSVNEILGTLGFEDLGKKELLIGGGVGDGGGGGGDSGGKVEEQLEGRDVEYMYGISEFLDWEPPSVVNLDDVLLSSSKTNPPAQHKFQAMRVPPLPKNRNATCGLHKEEILSQLREISKLEPEFDGDLEPLDALLSEEGWWVDGVNGGGMIVDG